MKHRIGYLKGHADDADDYDFRRFFKKMKVRR